MAPTPLWKDHVMIVLGKCDARCPAIAVVQVAKYQRATDSEPGIPVDLVFCAHHYRTYEFELIRPGADWQIANDYRGEL